jgi:hypothetical protein
VQERAKQTKDLSNGKQIALAFFKAVCYLGHTYGEFTKQAVWHGASLVTTRLEMS